MNHYIISLAVIVLLALASTSHGADGDQCGIHGLLDDTTCICYSGYVSSSPANADCDVTVPGTCVWENSTSTNTGGVSHLSNSTGFAANNLALYVESKVTAGRTTTTVSIGGSADANCVYPGPNFAKELDDEACNDVFIGTVPWAQASGCSFTEDTSDPDFVVYTAPIYVTNTAVQEMRGKQITQTVTDVLNIAVKFQKQISLSTNVQVFAPVNMFSAVTEQSYSPTLARGSVSFATSLQWPFTLTNGIIKTMPAGLTNEALNDTTVGGDCTAASGSVCFQQYNFKVNPGSECRLSGIYELEYDIECRGTDECPLDAGTKAGLTLSLQSSDFCASVETGITANAQLSTFQDADHLTTKSAFLIDQTGYFLVQVTSNQAVVEETNLASISVSVAGVPTILYTTAGGIQNAALSAVDNQDDSASFAVDFNDNLFVIPEDEELEYSFTVELEVGFAGNTKKRAIVTRNADAPSKAKTAAKVTLQNAPSDQQTDPSAATTSTVSFALMGAILFFCML